ncbi:MAG: type II secretion system F family protein, partial [Planctomycetota bacterium]
SVTFYKRMSFRYFPGFFSYLHPMGKVEENKRRKEAMILQVAMELFATTMSVHWETGGSLAPVLSSVARVARDRQEVARRIRSNIAQSQFSTIAVLGLIYFVALVLWLDRPEVMIEFASSSLGSAAIATTIVLQAVGIVWMNAISKPS